MSLISIIGGRTEAAVEVSLFLLEVAIERSENSTVCSKGPRVDKQAVRMNQID